MTEDMPAQSAPLPEAILAQTTAFLEAYAAWGKGGDPVLDPGTLLRMDPDDFEAGAMIFRMRAQFIRRFGFCAPSAQFLDILLPLGPVIEIGAGRGFLSHLLRNAGGDAIATDIDPFGMSGYGQASTESWLPVWHMDAVTAVDQHRDRTVLCSWPSLGGEWIATAACVMASGQTLALIGENCGGATGCDNLFDILERDFTPLDIDGTDAAIWQFPGIHDRLRIFRKG